MQLIRQDHVAKALRFAEEHLAPHAAKNARRAPPCLPPSVYHPGQARTTAYWLRKTHSHRVLRRIAAWASGKARDDNVALCVWGPAVSEALPESRCYSSTRLQFWKYTSISLHRTQLQSHALPSTAVGRAPRVSMPAVCLSCNRA